MRFWRKNRKTREEVKAEARAAALASPPRKWKGVDPHSILGKLKGKGWKPRLCTFAAWLAGWSLLGWALADALGPAGWKIAGGLLFLSIGGILPLWRVVVGGAVAFPPWDWHKGPDDAD